MNRNHSLSREKIKLMAAVQHIAYGCADRRRMEAFYTKVFGFKRARVFNPGTAGQFVMLRLGAVCLEFFQAPPEAAEMRATEQTVGYRHLAIEVEDLEAKILEIQAEGLEVDPIVDCSAVTPGLRVAFFRDPEGNVVELMQGWRDEENPPDTP